MAASAVATLVLLFAPSEAIERIVGAGGFTQSPFWRAVLVLVAGGVVAVVTWVALFALFRSRVGGPDYVPEVRAADAHPDAPTRMPLTVAELAEPTRPVTPPRPHVEPLRPGERIESFEISQRHAAETGAPTIDALLARLEWGVAARRPELRRAG